MIRVLHVFHNMGNGGIEHFVMDRYRKIDRSKVQFDFLMTSKEDGYFDSEIRLLGGQVFHTADFTKYPIRCFVQEQKIVRDNGYQIVHRHTGNAIAYIDLWAARLGRAKKLIIHSHNNSAERINVHRIAKKIFAFDCVRLACGKSAGEWLFGDKEFRVMNNAIDTTRYVFSKEKRYEFRKKYGISQETFVIGHVGRFDYQKNQEFLLDILKETIHTKENSVLMCIGDGQLRNSFEEKARSLGISKNIVLTGSIDNVADVINCFDVFCFPSNYEGFSITLIESQVNGLKCYASEGRVPSETNLSGNIQFIPLDNNPKEWARKIIGGLNTRDLTAIEKVVSAGFDLDTAVKEMQCFYLGLINE